MWSWDYDNYDDGNLNNLIRFQKFNEVYPTVDEWLADVADFGQNMIISDDIISPVFSSKIYYLMLGKYALSSIAYYDPLQFRLNVMRIYVSRYSELNKMVELVNAIKNLDVETVKLASQSISNTASNPNSDSETEVLPYINAQDVNVTKFPVIMALQQQVGAVNYEMINGFINDFKKEFQVVFFRNTHNVYIGGE